MELVYPQPFLLGDPRVVKALSEAIIPAAGAVDTADATTDIGGPRVIKALLEVSVPAV